jgi:hypothetical protein
MKMNFEHSKKHLNHKPLILLIALLTPSLLCAHTFDLGISNDSAHIQGTFTFEDSDTSATLGYDNHTDNGDAWFLGGFISDHINEDERMFGGVGGRLYYADYDHGNDNFDGTAFAFGGFYNYTMERMPNLSFQAEGYYAPEVTSFSNLESLFDLDIRAQYRFMPRVWGFVGYKYIEVEGEDEGSEKLIDEIQVGATLWF